MRRPPTFGRRGRHLARSDEVATLVLVLVLFALRIDIVVCSCAGVEPPTVSDATSKVFLDQVAAYVCSSGYVWNTEALVETVVCKSDNTWPTPVASCINSTTAPGDATIFDDCQEGDVVPPENSVAKGSITGKLHISTCAENFALMGNGSLVMTECIRNKWTTVHEVCEPAVNFLAAPRDCGEVSLLGHNTTQSYNIIPSGVRDGDCVRV